MGFDLIRLPLDTAEFEQRIATLSPTRRVPVLWDEEVCIWDSMAIGEYVNERYCQGRLWPEDTLTRALGRSMASEMHSSFMHLRKLMPMNCRARGRRVERTKALDKDIHRVIEIWQEALARNGSDGPWLLGQYSLCDAMFAPVVLRFQTYGVELAGAALKYCQQVLSDPLLQQWMDAARDEPWVNAHEEAGLRVDESRSNE